MISNLWASISIVGKEGLKRLLMLMILGAFLETISVGMIVPVLGILATDNITEKFPILNGILPNALVENRNTLIVAGLSLIAFLYIIKSLYLAFQAWWQAKYIYRFQYCLTTRLFEGYLDKPYVFHLQRNTSELFRNMTAETSHFCTAFSSVLLICAEITVMLGLGILLMWVNPIGTICAVSVIAGIALLYAVCIKNKLVQWGCDRQFHDGRRFKHLQQGLGGLKEILVFGREQFFVREYHRSSKSAMEAIAKVVTMHQMPRLLLEASAVFLLLLVVTINLTMGSALLNLIPVVFVFAGAAFRIIPSINRVMGAVQVLSNETPAINLIYNELKENTPDQSLESSNNFKKSDLTFSKFIEIKQLNYNYPNDDKLVLHNINLHVNQGQMIGFVGESGSGKSTLINVMLGLLPPPSGGIFIDGENISANLRSWQKSIGYVPQDIFLLDDSLRNNIALGVEDNLIDDVEINRSIDQANLTEFVDNQEDGVNMSVGERGVRISGGQKQRIGIARALYHKPQILILDEATSALDEDTENGILQTINNLHGKITIILVTHRKSTIKNCDAVYSLDNGKLIKTC